MTFEGTEYRSTRGNSKDVSLLWNLKPKNQQSLEWKIQCQKINKYSPRGEVLIIVCVKGELHWFYTQQSVYRSWGLLLHMWQKVVKKSSLARQGAEPNLINRLKWYQTYFKLLAFILVIQWVKLSTRQIFQVRFTCCIFLWSHTQTNFLKLSAGTVSSVRVYSVTNALTQFSCIKSLFWTALFTYSQGITENKYQRQNIWPKKNCFTIRFRLLCFR